MAATGTPTPNLGLRIPQGTDPASVDDINYNSNLLDTKIGAVGNDSVQDQIDSLNSNMSYWTLHPTSNTLTNGYTTYTLRDSRYFADYELLTINPEMGGWQYQSIVVPVNSFKYSTGIAIFLHDGGNVIEVDVKYKTDTSFEAKYIGSPSGTLEINVYGFLRK